MQVLREADGIKPVDTPSAVTIGVFDGVHLGHQALIGELAQQAHSNSLVPTVVTFDQHPARIVRPETAPRLLCDLEQRLELLEASGAERVYVVQFEAARARETAEEFVEATLVRSLKTARVVVGKDFHFGAGRKGDVTLLTELGDAHGFETVGTTLVHDPEKGDVVSSTRIRDALIRGDVAEAESLLGRPHEVRGIVEPGDQRGRTLGFPTANVTVPEEILLPSDGVYAGTYVRPDGSRHGAAVSIGRRPTFYAERGALLVEAHLLDFDGDLYGEVGEVQCHAWVRGQIRFPDADALIEQLHADIADCRRLLDRRSRA